eukprot:15197830-Alexandrium_andersonii.AAC.1
MPEFIKQGEGKGHLADELQHAQVEPILGCRGPTLGAPGPPVRAPFLQGGVAQGHDRDRRGAAAGTAGAPAQRDR